MKFFKKSKQELEKFKNNARIFFDDFRKMQALYLQLLFKRKKTEQEIIDFKKLKVENFKLSFFIMCCVAPLPFIVTSYFIFVPRSFWPDTLKRVLNLETKKESVKQTPSNELVL